MNHTPVSSSQIASVGYDPATRVLEITFKDGGTYAYDNVPANVHADLMSADSVGKAFYAMVKGKYGHRKV